MSCDTAKEGTAEAKVSYNGQSYEIAREGRAEILTAIDETVSKGKKKGSESQSVFYNPIQQYNRDLSVLAIKAFGEDYAIARAHRARRECRKSRGQKRKRGQETLQNGSTAEVPNLEASEERVTAKEDVLPTHQEPKEESLIDTGEGLEESPSTSALESNAIESKGRPIEQPFRILDALSATGLRALRYGKEIPQATQITANDLSSSATAAIKLNAEHNGLSNKIQPSTSDAIDHMHHSTGVTTPTSGRYHVIDLDPYGTAVPFIDAAVRAVVDGGLLCITCTDSAVFASLGYLEKTYSQYGGLPLKGPHAHEGGLRLVLHAIATSAARYGMSIEPLLSLSIDYYVRVFVRVRRSAAEVKFLSSKTMVVYNCDAGCGAWTTQPLARSKARQNRTGETVYTFTSALAPMASSECQFCGFKTHLAGPMWGGPLHNRDFIKRILEMLPTLDTSVYGTIPRIEGMLTLASNEELIDDHHATSNPITDTPHHTEESTTNITTTEILPDQVSAPKSEARPIPPTPAQRIAIHPFFITPPSLSRIMHCSSPSDAAFRGALAHLGYRTTRSHTKAGSIVTDAPWSVLWQVMREWTRTRSPVKEGAIKPGMPGYRIMYPNPPSDNANGKEEALKINFDEELGKRLDVVASSTSMDHSSNGTSNANGTGKVKKLVRYQQNPTPDWGPQSRAKG